MNPSEYLYLAHTVNALMKNIVKDLQDGVSVILEVPERVDANMLSTRLQEHLRDATMEIIRVEVSTTHTFPLESVVHALNVEHSEASNLTELLHEYGEGFRQVVYIDGIERTQQDIQQSWMRLFSDWAKTSQGRSSEQRETLPLLAILKGKHIHVCLPESNVRFRIHQWQCLPSSLEGSLLCQLAANTDVQEQVIWRSYILPALAGNDLILMDRLWDIIIQLPDNIMQQLVQYGQECKWDISLHNIRNDHKLLRFDKQKRITSTNKQLYQLWSESALQWTPEYGFEYHSALHALWKDDSTIKHRYWRGQAQLLLPQLDHLRLRICAYMDRRYDNNWPLKWGFPPPQISYDEFALKHSTAACEWGHLNWIVQQHTIRVRQDVLRLVKKSRDIRNTLAHHTPISYSDFQQLCHVMLQAESTLAS